MKEERDLERTYPIDELQIKWNRSSTDGDDESE